MIQSPQKPVPPKREGCSSVDKTDNKMNGLSLENNDSQTPNNVNHTAADVKDSPQLPIKPEKKGILSKIKKKLSGNPNRKKWRNSENVSPDEEFACDPDQISPLPVPMRRPKSHIGRDAIRPAGQWSDSNNANLRKTIAAPPITESASSNHRRLTSGEKSQTVKLSYVKCGNDNVPVDSAAGTSGISKANYAQADENHGARSKSATLPVSVSRLSSLPSSSAAKSTASQRLSLQSPVVASTTPDWVYHRRFEPVYQELKEPPRTWTLTKELFRLSKFGWYWGPLSRAEAEEKLTEQPDGAFLVRDSSDERYLLSLSFRSYGKTLHTRIEHLNGVFSFYALPECEGYNSIVDLIENSVRDSKAGVFCYSRSRSPNGPSFPVRLTTPVSRFTQVRTLQYLCRFVIRQYTRLDHIQQLPLPTSIKGWLEESQF